MQYLYPGLANNTLDNIYIHEWSWPVGLGFFFSPTYSQSQAKQKKKMVKKINLCTGYLKGHSFETKLKQYFIKVSLCFPIIKKIIVISESTDLINHFWLTTLYTDKTNKQILLQENIPLQDSNIKDKRVS